MNKTNGELQLESLQQEIDTCESRKIGQEVGLLMVGVNGAVKSQMRFIEIGVMIWVIG